MVLKPVNDLLPHYLSPMLTERIESGCAIRDYVNKVGKPLPRTNCLMSFSYRSLTVWNSLPCDLRRERSLFNGLNYLSAKSPYQLS